MKTDGTHSRVQQLARMGHDLLDWFFRDRRTGRISVVQLPNAPLVVWFVASAASRLGPFHGAGEDVLAIVGSVALAIWAIMEILSGVNPFRRLLGLVVLAWIVVGHLLTG